jgi:hypothetical protein
MRDGRWGGRHRRAAVGGGPAWIPLPPLVVEEFDPAPTRTEAEAHRHRDTGSGDVLPVDGCTVHRVQVLEEDGILRHREAGMVLGQRRIADYDVTRGTPNGVVAACERIHLACIGARMDDEDERWDPHGSARPGVGAGDDDRPVRQQGGTGDQCGERDAVHGEGPEVTGGLKPVGECGARADRVRVDDDLARRKGERGSAGERDVQIHGGLLEAMAAPRIGGSAVASRAREGFVDNGRVIAHDVGRTSSAHLPRTLPEGSVQVPPVQLVIVSILEAFDGDR